jgi:hypothetical protein
LSSGAKAPSGITCHQDPLLFEDNRSNAKIIRPDTTMLSLQLAIATNPRQVEWQELNASGKLDGLLECLIRPSKLLIIACLPDLGVPPPEHFFYGDDHHGELLRGCGGDPCHNGFLTTEP